MEELGNINLIYYSVGRNISKYLTVNAYITLHAYDGLITPVIATCMSVKLKMCRATRLFFSGAHACTMYVPCKRLVGKIQIRFVVLLVRVSICNFQSASQPFR